MNEDINVNNEDTAVNNEDTTVNNEDTTINNEDTNEVIVPNNRNNTIKTNKEILLRIKKEYRAKLKKDADKKKQQNKKLIKNKKPITNYIRLITGEELRFNESENNSYPLLLKDIIPYGIIQNIIRRIPISVHNRILYLAKFRINEENTEVLGYNYYERLRDDIYTNYVREFRLRYIFRKFLLFWREYKLNKKYVQTPDPITLSEPEKPIIIYNWPLKQKFIFDAKSLANSINSQLLYYQNGFASPQDPKNLITNLPFSYKELVSIYFQLQHIGEAKWALSSLKEFNFNRRRWELYTKSQLYLNAIRNEIIKLDTYDGRELFTDFIISRLEEYNLQPSEYVERAYERGVIYCPTHHYIERLKPVVILYYESQYFKVNRDNVIRSSFLRIYKGQSKFIHYMVSNGFL